MSQRTYQLTDQDLLYYLHIPKTAGTSFTDILKANFKPEEVSFSKFIGDYLKYPPEKMETLRAVSGHYFYNIGSFTHTHRNLVYITILRDPVERTISNYAYIQRIPAHYAYEIVKSQSLLDFVTDKRTQGLYVNSQTRYLAMDPNTTEIAKELIPDPLDPFDLWRKMESYSPNGFSDPALLERAQARLKNFAYVGLAEQFDESIELLCYTFGWPVPPAQKVFNVSPNRPAHEDIPQEVLDIIRENTQLDAKLYETGKQLFNAHYEQMLNDHPEKRAEISLRDNPITKLERQIDFQKRLIDTLQEEKLTLEEKLRELHAVVDRRESSFGWRLILRFNKIRLKLVPQGSKREQVYLKIRGR